MLPTTNAGPETGRNLMVFGIGLDERYIFHEAQKIEKEIHRRSDQNQDPFFFPRNGVFRDDIHGDIGSDDHDGTHHSDPIAVSENDVHDVGDHEGLEKEGKVGEQRIGELEPGESAGVPALF